MRKSEFSEKAECFFETEQVSNFDSFLNFSGRSHACIRLFLRSVSSANVISFFSLTVFGLNCFLIFRCQLGSSARDDSITDEDFRSPRST